MKTIDLCGKWEFANEDGVLRSGTVPGCVHTDLFTNAEMFWEKNSQSCRFIEQHSWKYIKRFRVDNLDRNPVLVFEGLDTYCEIYLNHQKIGSAENMFIPHRFMVEGVLREGDNLLEVHFQTPIKAVEGKEKLTGAFCVERLHTRRMQCTYGWDWVDRFVTCGIYRPVYLIFENGMDIDNVYVFTANIDEYSAQIKVTETFKNFELGGIVRTNIMDPQGKQLYSQEHYCEEAESILYFDIENPQLWFPRPYGGQPLYEIEIIVGEHVHRQQFGIRTVKILQLPDKEESTIARCRELQQTDSGREYDQNTETSCFIPIINGVKIFCTGANWVPCEPFPSAETDEKITSLLEKAVLAGINMIRVWGGGLFEKEHFYNECDRLGILVTQDFLMACGQYPESDESFQEHIRKEAEFAAVYLRNHPSLVWWTGDNENSFDGADTLSDYSGRTIARKVVAKVLDKLDYNRRFLFSSPYGGNKYASKTVGTTHNTQFMCSLFTYLAREDISDYREYWNEYTARFIAEEPILGAVSRRSLLEFISEENEADYEMWLYHSKTNPALNKELMDIAVDFACKLFGESRDWEGKSFKMRYLQYEWIRFTLGIARSNLWFNGGILYWMLNDCWPAAMGWSICDYYAREKAGYYALKEYGKNVAVYLSKGENGYILHISNILNTVVECNLQVFVLNGKTGERTQVLHQNATIGNTCETFLIKISLESKDVLIAEVTAGETVLRNWYKEGIPRLEQTDSLHWECIEQGVEVWSEQYVHVVEIEGAENVSDNYFSLLPGEKKVIAYEGTENFTVKGYTFYELFCFNGGGL